MQVSDNIAKRHPVLLFYVLAFVLSWMGWIPQAILQSENLLLSLLGGGGPTLAAVFVLLLIGERDRIADLFKRLVWIRAGALWFVFTLAYWFVVAAMALAALRMTGDEFGGLSRFPWATLTPIFIAMLLSNVWEEIGWRGFALPRLRHRWGDLQVSLLMGSLWFLWHLPLMLNPESSMSTLPWYGELVFSLSLTVIYTWLCANTEGSLFFVTLFHALSNTVAFVLLELGVFQSSYIYVVGLTALSAVSILVIYGSRHFSRKVANGTSNPGDTDFEGSERAKVDYAS